MTAEVKREGSPVLSIVDYIVKVRQEAEEQAYRMDILLGKRAVRFPRPLEQEASARYGKQASREFIIVEAGDIDALGDASKMHERHKFSTGLMTRLGFIAGEDDISLQMKGEIGNKRVSFRHATMSYRAEALVHNMGNGKYLISGFVVCHS